MQVHKTGSTISRDGQSNFPSLRGRPVSKKDGKGRKQTAFVSVPEEEEESEGETGEYEGEEYGGEEYANVATFTKGRGKNKNDYRRNDSRDQMTEEGPSPKKELAERR